MQAKLFFYSLGVWFLFVIAAILNGIFRNSFITPKLGELIGHQISSVIFIIIVFTGTYFFIRLLGLEFNARVLLTIGALWLMLTVLFEFGFGHYIAGHSWEKLLADYNILKGRLWSLVLIATFLAPYLAGLLLKIKI